MESFNKAISFILGLIVVVVLFAVISRRLNLGKKITFLPLADKSVTVTIIPTPTSVKKLIFTIPSPIVTRVATKGSQIIISPIPKSVPVSIPKTGPELLFPSALSALLAGIYLKKKS